MWIVVESGPEGMEVYPHTSRTSALHGAAEILTSLTGWYASDPDAGMWAQMISDNGLVLMPQNSIAIGPIALFAREVQGYGMA